MKITIYPSNHGFGHATRMAALASSFQSFGAEVFICTDRPKFLFERLSGGKLHYRTCALDVGVKHKENLATDLEATKSALLNLFSRREELVAEEVEFLRDNCIDFVVADAPYFVVEACGWAEIPVYLVSNFDWYFIYSELFRDDEEMKPILNTIFGLYRRANGAYRLNIGSCPNSLRGFRDAKEIGILAAKPRASNDLRSKYSIKKTDDILLIMFGGEGKMELPLDVVCEAWQGVVLSPFENCAANNHIYIPKDEDFNGLIHISKLVICKPGYSSFAEVLAAGKPMLYMPRKNYPEEPCLISGLRGYPTAKQLDNIPNSLDAWVDLFEFDTEQATPYPLANETLAGDIINSYFKYLYPSDRLICVCDMGSNNFNYLLYNHGKKTKLHKLWLTTGLAKGFEAGMLSDASICNAKHNLEPFFEIDAKIESEKRLIATSISRKAENAYVVLDWIQTNWAYNAKIITAKKEMNYAWFAAEESMKEPQDELVLDIGGASTELAWLNPAGRQVGLSLDFGLVALIEAHQSGSDTQAIISKELERLTLSNKDNIILIGLTALLFRVELESVGVSKDLAKYELSVLETIITRLSEFVKNPSHHPTHSKRDILSMYFVAIILHRLMDKLDINTFSLCFDGINYGFVKTLK